VSDIKLRVPTDTSKGLEEIKTIDGPGPISFDEKKLAKRVNLMS
jgi:hypothetical protein